MLEKWIGFLCALLLLSKLYEEFRWTRRRWRTTQNSERYESASEPHADTAYTNESDRRTSTETGPMTYFANNPHGLSDKEYRFNYKKIGGYWRAYILKMPSLGLRNASFVATHRLRDSEYETPYICWDRPVGTLTDMQTISRCWADNIQEYIATGQTFG